MAVDERTAARDLLREVGDRLAPDSSRDWAMERLGELFASGRTPAHPEGFLRGSLVATSTWGPTDALLQRVAAVYMPWLGKSFDPASLSGVNVLKTSARTPMKVLWPNYVPERELADRLEAFPFRTRIAPGELDPDVDVLKIDYNLDTNPTFLIRRILDELVEVDDGLFLGKILMRRRGSWSLLGYFSLER
jgi:hypothetical protein